MKTYGLVLVRSDEGDGGWSLHTPEQIADAKAHNEALEALERERGKLRSFRKTNPASAIGAEIVGGVLGPGKLVKAAGTVKGAAATSGGLGAVYGFGASEGGLGNRALH